MTDQWREILRDAESRINDPVTRAKVAALMERAVTLALQKAAGQDVDADLRIVTATAASLGSAEVAIAAHAVSEAIWSTVQKIVWKGIFGMAVP